MIASVFPQVMKNAVKAKEVLLASLNSGNSNTRVFQQLLDTAMQSEPVDEELALEVFDRVMNEDGISKEDQLKFSERRLEFVEDFSADVSK